MNKVDQLELLETFLSLVQTGNLKQTAERHQISKATASRRITTLEKMVGETLFLREMNGFELTAQGEELKNRATEIVANFDRLCAPAVSGKDFSGTIHISAPSAIGNGLLIPWLKLFQDLHPEVMVDLTLTLGPVRILSHECDIRLNHGLYPCERATARELGFMRRMMVASPEYLSRNGFPKHPDELTHYSLLGGNDLLGDSPLVLFNGEERITVPYFPKLLLRDHGVSRTAAIAGMGIAVHAFRFDALEYVRKRVLIHVLPEWEPSPTPVSLQLPTNRPPKKAVKELADFIAEKWRAHPELISFEEQSHA